MAKIIMAKKTRELQYRENNFKNVFFPKQCHGYQLNIILFLFFSMELIIREFPINTFSEKSMKNCIKFSKTFLQSIMKSINMCLSGGTFTKTCSIVATPWKHQNVSVWGWLAHPILPSLNTSKLPGKVRLRLLS